MTRIDNWTRPNIRSLVPYSSAKDEYSGADALFLDANENPFGTYNRYPDPQQRKLKAVLVKQTNISPKQVFIGNGSDEVIDLLLRIFCEPGMDKIATFSPTYGMYDVSANIHNVGIVKVPLDANFDIVNTDISPILSDDKIKILFLCSPNNPTGNDLNSEKMMELIESFNGIVCVDEAYIEFSEQDSMAKWIEKHDNLVVARTMSKARGLAGARVGYAFTNEKIIELLNKVKPPYNISALNQNEAIRILENKDRFEQQRNTILNERSRLIEQLGTLSSVEQIYPTASNFILIKVKDADNLYAALLERNIIVRNRSKQIPNTLRISVGTPQENQQLLKAIKEIEL
ncbi:MAG: histidinol-phosphate transaminase [Fluviicola sp. XM-24bin1]|nr:MAG: histidinol-phosphate transaminase [Fluviicola sp. XM-24bin1]